MTNDPSLLQWAAFLKVYGAMAVVGAGAVVIVLWWRERRAVRRSAREAEAKRVYASYLLQAMQHPELARPGPTDVAKGRQRAQYQWFVGYVLTVCEEILLIDPSPAWQETLLRQLAPHRAFLTSAAFLDGPYRGLTRDVRRLISATAGAEQVAPEFMPAPVERPMSRPTLKSV